MNILELFSSFEFKFNEKEFNEFSKKAKDTAKGAEKNFKKTEDTFLKFSGALDKIFKALPFTALIASTQQTLNKFTEFDNLIKRTGLSEEYVREMQVIAEASNLSSTVISASLEKISEDLADFKVGEGNINPYAWLGVDVKDKNVEQVFNDILEKIKNIEDVGQRSRALRNLGLDENLSNLNFNNLEGINKSLFLNKEDTENLKKLNNEFSLFKINISLLKDKIVAFSTPLKYFFELTNRLIKSFTSIIERTIGLKNFIKALSVIILAFTATISPLTVIISAVALAIDDLLTYMRGGKSFIGDFIDGSGKIGESLKPIILIIGALIEGFLTLIGVFIEKLPAALKAVFGVFDGFLKLLNAILETIYKIIEPLIYVYKYMAKISSMAVGKIFDFFGDDEEKKENKKLSIEEIQRNIDVFYKSLPQPNENLYNNYQSSKNNNINIQNSYNIEGNNAFEITNKIKDFEKENIDTITRIL